MLTQSRELSQMPSNLNSPDKQSELKQTAQTDYPMYHKFYTESWTLVFCFFLLLSEMTLQKTPRFNDKIMGVLLCLQLIVFFSTSCFESSGSIEFDSEGNFIKRRDRQSGYVVFQVLCVGVAVWIFYSVGCLSSISRLSFLSSRMIFACIALYALIRVIPNMFDFIDPIICSDYSSDPPAVINHLKQRKKDTIFWFITFFFATLTLAVSFTLAKYSVWVSFVLSALIFIFLAAKEYAGSLLPFFEPDKRNIISLSLKNRQDQAKTRVRRLLSYGGLSLFLYSIVIISLSYAVAKYQLSDLYLAREVFLAVIVTLYFVAKYMTHLPDKSQPDVNLHPDNDKADVLSSLNSEEKSNEQTTSIYGNVDDHRLCPDHEIQTQAKKIYYGVYVGHLRVAYLRSFSSSCVYIDASSLKIISINSII
jgi:hypothetical protein